MQHKWLLLALLLTATRGITAGVTADATPAFEAVIDHLVVKQERRRDTRGWRLHAFLNRGSQTLVATGSVDGSNTGTLALYETPSELGKGMEHWGHMNVLVEDCTLYANVYRSLAPRPAQFDTNGQQTGTGSEDKSATVRAQSSSSKDDGFATDGQQTGTGKSTTGNGTDAEPGFNIDVAGSGTGKTSSTDQITPLAECGVGVRGQRGGTRASPSTVDCVRTLQGSPNLGTNGQQDGTGKRQSSTAGSATFVGSAAFENAICIGGGKR